MAWGVSLLAHMWAGVACCFMAGSASIPAEPTEGPTLAEVPVAVEWLPRPEVEHAANREEPKEVSPESLTLQPVPASEPPPVPLPPPTREVVATLLPPEAPDASAALFMASALPPIADMTSRTPEATKPSAPPLAEPAPSAPMAIAAQEPAAQAPVAFAAAPSPDNVPPAYPRAARRHGHEGLVVVRARVSPSGACIAAAILRSSGHQELDDAAAEAVRAWQFRPALLDGTPVEAELEIPIRFRLTD